MMNDKLVLMISLLLFGNPSKTNPCSRMIMSWRKGTMRVMEKERKTLTLHARDGTNAAIDHNYGREEGMSLC